MGGAFKHAGHLAGAWLTLSRICPPPPPKLRSRTAGQRVVKDACRVDYYYYWRVAVYYR